MKNKDNMAPSSQICGDKPGYFNRLVTRAAIGFGCLEMERVKEISIKNMLKTSETKRFLKQRETGLAQCGEEKNSCVFFFNDWVDDINFGEHRAYLEFLNVNKHLLHTLTESRRKPCYYMPIMIKAPQ
jgi:hypothetical protein